MACLDTSFLIDVLTGVESARTTMESLADDGEHHTVTPIAATELWIGANLGSAQEYQRTHELLDSLVWLDISRGCARSAGRLQADLIESGSQLGFNDCLIAATAIEHGQELVTGDSDFERVPELRTRTY